MRRRKPFSPWYWRIVSKALAPAGEQLVDVALVADVEDELVLWRVENPVQRDGQFDDPEIRAQVAAGLGKDTD